MPRGNIPPEIHEATRSCEHFVNAPWNDWHNRVYVSWGAVRRETTEEERAETRARGGRPRDWVFALDSVGNHVMGWIFSYYDPSFALSQRWGHCSECPPPDECGCWDCSHSADGRGNGMCGCEECEEQRRADRIGGFVHNYGHKPTPIFYGSGPTFLGVELELEGDSCEAAEPLVVAIGDRAYLKEDGSLDDGFELVTHPHDLTAHREAFGWYDILRTARNYGMGATDNCGLHVHVNRSTFAGPAHAFRWQSLMYRNEDAMVRVARRRSNDWARWPSADSRRAELPILSKGIKNPYDPIDAFGHNVFDRVYLERYRALNFLNRDTVELRMFASTTDHGELMSALELVHSSIEYTRQMPTVPRATALSLPAFRDYVKGNGFPSLEHVL